MCGAIIVRSQLLQFCCFGHDIGDLYIIGAVCGSRKMITSSWESPVTTWTPFNHPVQLQVSFDGSRLVFHGSMSVFIGFQGFRLVSRWFHGFSWILVGFHGFSRYFHCFFMVFGLPNGLKTSSLAVAIYLFKHFNKKVFYLNWTCQQKIFLNFLYF